MPESLLDELKVKHYNIWNRYEWQGSPIEVLPSSRDVPNIDFCSYNPLSDTFSLRLGKTFSRYEGGYEKIKLDDNIFILQTSERQVVGIDLYNVRETGIPLIRKNIKDKLGEFLKSIRNKFESITARAESAKELGVFDINRRTVGFLEDLIDKNLELLQ